MSALTEEFTGVILNVTASQYELKLEKAINGVDRVFAMSDIFPGCITQQAVEGKCQVSSVGGSKRLNVVSLSMQN